MSKQHFGRSFCLDFMRNIFICSALLLSIASCKKDKPPTEMTGVWEIETSTAMMGTINYPPGNGRIIFLGRDFSFEQRRHDTIDFRGTYSIERRRDCFGDGQLDFLRTTAPNSGEAVITISGNKLILNSPNCFSDGVTTTFRKQ